MKSVIHIPIHFAILGAFLSVFLSAGCSRVDEIPLTGNAWLQTDLLALELPSQVDPTYDLVAAYARQTDTDIEMRFDLLGSPDPYEYDLILFLDAMPGGSAKYPWGEADTMDWDIAISYPAFGQSRAFFADGSPASIRPRGLRLDIQDAITVRISKTELEGITSTNPLDIVFQAFIKPSGQQKPVDSIGPIRMDAPNILSKAPLLIAFWDTLPSATPVQALRRWNGAHTGPFGQRHGLSVVLDAARDTNVPVAVLDLKRYDRLAVLEALGGLETVRQMCEEGQLLLPDLAYGDPQTAAKSLLLSAQAGARFDLAGSKFLYGSALAEGKQPYQAAFARLEDSTHLLQSAGLRLVPLPEEHASKTEVDQQGLSLATRMALLKLAFSTEPSELVVLGGSLPASAWGDSLVAPPAFAYISGHPWIQALNEEGLLRLQPLPGQTGCADLLCSGQAETEQRASLRAGLEMSPDGLFTGLAWQAYLNLTDPVTDPSLRALRESYLSQVWLLLYAAQWENHPTSLSTCADDLNNDGNVECVLASANMLMILEPLGARLVITAARQQQKTIQIIGPRSQIITGLGDPSEWHPGSGSGSDPQEIAGAFGDPLTNIQTYRYENAPGQITFTNPSDRTRKIFRLEDNGLRIDVESAAPLKTQIPLLLGSSAEWSPGWLSSFRSQSEIGDGNWSWSNANGFRIRVSVAGARATMIDFTESLPLLKQPEDPNREYPAGAYVPFPFALVDLASEGNYSVELSLGSGR